MNNDLMTMLYILWILMAASGIFAYKSYLAIKNWLNVRRQRKVYPSIEPATDDNVCKGPHKWDKTIVSISPLPVSLYNVCLDCGYVSCEDYSVKLNGPGLEVYRNNVKRRDERRARQQKVFTKKQQETDQIMYKMIRMHVEQLGNDVHKNSEVLQQFFRRSNIELESLFIQLNKELEEEEKRG